MSPGVDDRLERGARLAPRLGRPVELAPAEVEAADEGSNLARGSVDRDERPFDRGLLLEREHRLPRDLRGEDLHAHDVAGLDEDRGVALSGPRDALGVERPLEGAGLDARLPPAG